MQGKEPLSKGDLFCIRFLRLGFWFMCSPDTPQYHLVGRNITIQMKTRTSSLDHCASERRGLILRGSSVRNNLPTSYQLSFSERFFYARVHIYYACA